MYNILILFNPKEKSSSCRENIRRLGFKSTLLSAFRVINMQLTKLTHLKVK